MDDVSSIRIPPAWRTDRLLGKARREQWSAKVDVDWVALDFSRTAHSIRDAMSEIYRFLAAAERAGVGLCVRMMESCPEGAAREFMRIQVEDEKRHSEFFARTCSLLGGEGEQAPAVITKLFAEARSINSSVELFAFGQVIETAAQTLFASTADHSGKLSARAVRLPGYQAVEALIETITRRVARDEARHIAFGRNFITSNVRGMPRSDRERLGLRISGWAGLFDEAFSSTSHSLARLGIDAGVVLREVKDAQVAWVNQVGLVDG